MTEYESILVSGAQESGTRYLRLVIEKGVAYVVSDSAVRGSVAKTVRENACQSCENRRDGCVGIKELDAEGFLLSGGRFVPPSHPVKCRVSRTNFRVPKPDSTP